MAKDFIDVIQKREYNESTGEFHDRIGKGSSGKGWQLLCNTTDRLYTPFYNFVHKVCDFNNTVTDRNDGIQPRPTLKELHVMWDSYVTLCKDIVYYKGMNVSDVNNSTAAGKNLETFLKE